MKTKKMKVFEKNADSFEKPLETIKKKINNFVTAFMMTLDIEDDKVKQTPENMQKIVIFERELKKFIDNSGYRQLLEKFVADTPKLIIKAK